MTDSTIEPLRLSLRARVGRKDGTIVEIDRGGARVQHSGPLPLGGQVQLSFATRNDAFVALTHVLACRVVGLGLGEGGSTLFESRLAFGPDKGAAVFERLAAQPV